MPFPRIRKLPCEVSKLLDNNPNIPKFTYLNPSSAGPYVCIRTLDKVGTRSEVNHMTLYHRDTGSLRCIKTNLDLLQPTCAFYRGIEDARIFLYKDRLWFIATSTHITNCYMSQMMIGYFNKDVTHVEFIQFLDFGAKPMKNTCPFIYQDKICVIDTFTLLIYEIVCETQEDGTEIYKAVVLKKLTPCANLALHMMRGSTSPVHLHGNIWGCIVHEHIRQAREKTISLAYISYWLEFDIERGVVTLLSSPFIVAQWGVEFVSGMEYYKDRDVVELFLGINDQIAVVAKTNLHDLRVGQ